MRFLKYQEPKEPQKVGLKLFKEPQYLKFEIYFFKSQKSYNSEILKKYFLKDH